MSHTDWKPMIRDPDLVHRANAIIDRTADFLAAQLPDRSPSIDPGVRRFFETSTGIEGVPAVALLFAYRHRERGDAESRQAAEAWLNRATHVIATAEEVKPWLYSGAAGCAWVLTHVLGHLNESADDDPVDEFDALLADFIGARADIDPELVMGLSGLGTYFLERLPRPGAAAAIQMILERLEAQADVVGETITWRKSPAALSRAQRAEYPAGLYNLGIPHGVPGVVGFLARVCASPAACPKSRALLVRSVRWLLAQKNSNRSTAFPYFSAPGLGPVEDDSRLAWCYGDLAMAVILWMAASVIASAESDEWARQALKSAQSAARRDERESGVEDGMICHGAAGLAHLFNRLHQASGHPELGRASQRWFRRTLDYFDPSVGPVGYACWRRDPPDAPTDEARLVRAESYGLPTGVVGIALVLLAGIGRVAPEWDRLLCASISPGPKAGGES